MRNLFDWTDIPIDTVKDPLLTFAQDTFVSRKKGNIDYVLSPRDIIQFVDSYRDLKEDFPDWDMSEILAETIREAVVIKYTDPQEEEFIKGRATETFGVTL